MEQGPDAHGIRTFLFRWMESPPEPMVDAVMMPRPRNFLQDGRPESPSPSCLYEL